MVAKKKAPAKEKESKEKEAEVTLGKAVVVYPRNSQHWIALSSPTIVQIQGVLFIQGTQITGNPSHRFEQKRTMMPFEQVGTIVEFQEEEDIWSKPQPRNIAPTQEDVKSATLTSHERGASGEFGNGPRHGGPRHNNNGGRRNRNRHKQHRSDGGDSANDARFQQQYDSNKDRNFNR